MLPLLLLACAPADPFEDQETWSAAWADAAAPTHSEEVDGAEAFHFDPADGPVCLRGGPFTASVRDQAGEDLILFLAGGGACWDDYCLAIEDAPPGIPGVEVLDPGYAANPVAGWDQVYLPYCDGSLFLGDVVADDDEDGEPDRYQRGQANLAAGLRLAAEQFPAPRRVLLAGSSGGAYGTFGALILARKAFPGVPIDIFNDSGPGIADPDDPDFLQDLVQQWGAEGLLPEDCEGCFDGGHLTPMLGWALERDRDLRVAMFSNTRDQILSEWFLGIGGSAFEDALLAELSALEAQEDERFASFIVDGDEHTSLIGDVSGVVGEVPDGIAELIHLGSMEGSQIDGVSVAQWLEWYVTEDARWESLAD
ncbi:MAG: vtpJ-therm [Alphaproteobacteria bacterium]|nr:vtpJ-therm [Alphaproteobacteria bacterium]MCB9796247.1 vtpJ-therm [Alphaproteobacteria bacterium]